MQVLLYPVITCDRSSTATAVSGPVPVSKYEKCAEYEKHPNEENERRSPKLGRLIADGTPIWSDEARFE